jgi:hypothetical protein
VDRSIPLILGRPAASEQMLVSFTRHPFGSREMAIEGSAGALDIVIRVYVQRDARNLAPVGTLRIGANINLHSTRCPGRYPTFRDFVPWRFLDAGTLSLRCVSLLPASKNQHIACPAGRSAMPSGVTPSPGAWERGRLRCANSSGRIA